MKILYLVASDGIFLNMRGGAGTHIRGTIKGFEENGINVKTFIQGDYHRRYNNCENNKNNVSSSKKISLYLPSFIKILGRELKSMFRFRNFKKTLEQVIQREKPDLIFERSCLYASYGNKLAKKYKIPHYIETSGCLVELFNDSYGITSVRIANYIESKKLANADCVVAEADSAIDFIRDKFFLKDKTIISKPLGVNFNLTAPDISAVNTLKTKYEITNDFKVIGYVGTFASYHRIESLLPVFEKTQNLKIKYLLVGNGGNYDYIKYEVSNRGLKNVILTGYVSSGIENYFSLMDIGLIPDCEQHMAPIKYYEYGLHNLCPLVPNYNAFDKLLSNGLNGYKFNNNSESLTDVIKKINDLDLSEIKKIGQKWHDYVLSNYSWKKVVKAVINQSQKAE